MRTTREEFDPTDFDEFVGQDVIKDRVDIAVRSALKNKRRLDHILLDGPGGSGKSTLAGLLAARMEEPLVVKSEALTVKDLRNLLYETELGVVILFDEIHSYPKPTLNAMLPLFESGWFDGVHFPFTTGIVATTAPELLTAPFISRFIHCRYVDYTDDEMLEIIRRMAHCAKVKMSDKDLRQLAIAAGGVPRQARSFIIAARDLGDAHRPTDVATILAFERREPDGLSVDHLDYLRIINENHGRAGLEQLCSRLGKHRSIVLSLERLLLERRLIFLASDGRTITHEGRKRLHLTVAA